MNIELTDLDMILDYLETTSLEPHDDYTSEFDIDYLMADTTMKNYAAFLSIVESFEGNDSNE